MSVDRLDRAAEYRRQAQEIRTIVQTIWINEARKQLLEAAKHLEELAQEEERKAHAADFKPMPPSLGRRKVNRRTP
jgi:Fe-S cluster biosynthesis and repair protein YggX